MKDKELIIQLLLEDLKHNQLVLGLEKLGFSRSSFHYLGIEGVIAKLMNVPEGRVSDSFGAEYAELMKESVNYGISVSDKSLRSLAESGYALLKEMIKIESIKK